MSLHKPRTTQQPTQLLSTDAGSPPAALAVTSSSCSPHHHQPPAAERAILALSQLTGFFFFPTPQLATLVGSPEAVPTFDENVTVLKEVMIAILFHSDVVRNPPSSSVHSSSPALSRTALCAAARTVLPLPRPPKPPAVPSKGGAPLSGR